MTRRDLLTYDIGHDRRPALSGVSVRLIVLLAVVIVLAAGLMIWTAHPTDQMKPAKHRSVVPAASARATPASTPTRPGQSGVPALVGSDAEESNHAPGRSSSAASRFIAAWLDRDPKTRRPALEATAAPGLVEQLMLTSRENIPTTKPNGPPVLEDASAYSVQFVQTLDDGMQVRLILVADPGARYAWLTTSVEQA